MKITTEWVRERDQKGLELARTNQARVLAGEGSPKILVGGINLDTMPNFHTMNMIELGCSVVAVTPHSENALRPDYHFVHPTESLADTLWRLPPKWKPDFFWDPQFEQGHYFAIGVGDLDIPTVVSFNHSHLGQVLHHAQGMFDCMIAPSRQMAHLGDCVLPWGASWGTMEKRFELLGEFGGEEKDVDVSLTIGFSNCGEESVRWDVVRELKAITARRPEWKIVITSGLGQHEYFDLIARSRCSISVGAWGGAMTYRPLEVIGLDSVLIQVDETAYGSTAPLEEFFPPEWFVGAIPLNLESAIEKALAWTKEGRDEVRAALAREYSYARQYGRLLNVAMSTKKKPKLSKELWSRKMCAINEATGYSGFADIHRWALTDDDLLSMEAYPDKEWDVCFWQPKEPEQRAKWMRELSLRKEPPLEIYRRFAELERPAQPVATGP